MSEWNEIQLDEVLKVYHGYAFAGEGMTDKLTGEPIVVSIGNFSYTGGFRFSSTRVREFRGEYPTEFDLTPGDLLVVMTCQTSGGEILGVPGIVPSDGRIYLHNQRIGRVECNEEKLDKTFAYYLFLAPETNRKIFNTATGTKILHTSPRRIGQVSCRIPPLLDQRKIGALLGALDDKIALNERIAATALELAEAAYVEASACTEWESVTLKDAARWMSGGTPKTSEPDYWGGEIPWISALSLKSPWIDSSDRNVTELGATSGTRLASTDVVLFVVRGSSLKTEFRIGLTQRQVAFGQDCKALIARRGVDPHILFHGIRSKTANILDMVDETSIGAGRLSTDLISKLEIRIPKGSSDSVVSEVRTLDSLAATRQKENRALSTLRDTLLPQLMSGRLRVRDAEKIAEDQV
ncbi:restriction endonuclease subunit S [Streptomyces microflavus]|uniref:Restriction endonuclease subunit S n=1 Tax=Streptomyces microflavus TaxID=1919 RepID=A0ABV1Q188_STRMI